MIKVDLRAVWRVNVRGVERELDEMLIAVLGGLERTGKLGGATSDAKVSYRHAYNLVKRWGEFLGAPLVVMRQGSGTKLTPLGERLLWAGRRVQSRLAPELEGLAGDFTRGLNDALGTRPGMLAIHASHDFAVALLRERLGASHALELQSRGSFDALAALLRGDCDIAGFHLADGPLGQLMARRYAEGLAGRDVLLLALADRTQGLIVAKGNPKKVKTIADLAKPGVRFINRQRGSGTRALLEFLLTAAGHRPRRHPGLRPGGDHALGRRRPRGRPPGRRGLRARGRGRALPPGIRAGRDRALLPRLHLREHRARGRPRLPRTPRASRPSSRP